jgi:hypothetical protein
VPSALREFADDLNAAAARLARVVTSIAEAIEAREGEDVSPASGSAPADAPARATRRKAAGRSASSSSTSRAPAAKRPAGTRPGARTKGAATADTVRAAIEELGPATAAQIADHINQSAGRRVIDGRAVPGHARSAGARVVMRRGERLYRL